jgi:hypothetical protein
LKLPSISRPSSKILEAKLCLQFSSFERRSGRFNEKYRFFEAEGGLNAAYGW